MKRTHFFVACIGGCLLIRLVLSTERTWFHRVGFFALLSSIVRFIVRWPVYSLWQGLLLVLCVGLSGVTFYIANTAFAQGSLSSESQSQNPSVSLNSYDGNLFSQQAKNLINLKESLTGTNTIKQIIDNTIFFNSRVFQQRSENTLVIRDGVIVAARSSQPDSSSRPAESSRVSGWTKTCTDDGTLASKLQSLLACD